MIEDNDEIARLGIDEADEVNAANADANNAAVGSPLQLLQERVLNMSNASGQQQHTTHSHFSSSSTHHLTTPTPPLHHSHHSTTHHLTTHHSLPPSPISTQSFPSYLVSYAHSSHFPTHRLA